MGLSRRETRWILGVWAVLALTIGGAFEVTERALGIRAGARLQEVVRDLRRPRVGGRLVGSLDRVGDREVQALASE